MGIRSETICREGDTGAAREENRSEENLSPVTCRGFAMNPKKKSNLRIPLSA